MKILIMKFRNIGDVLLTSPMASALATLPDKPQVTFLVKRGTEEMLTGHPDIHEVLTLPEREKGESKLAFLHRQWAFIRGLKAKHFDVSINTTEGDRGLILGWLSGAKWRIGYLKAQEKWWRKHLVTEPHTGRSGRFHTVLRNLDLISEFVTPTDIRVSFHFTPLDELAVIDKLKQAGWDGEQPLVHVHPVSRWFFKCWRDDYMAQTIDYLQQELGYQVVLTCAPDSREKERLANIIAQCHSQPIDLGERLTLKQTGALSALAKLFFGVDSAPMHMAAAVDTPVVAIFGPSGTFDWGPWPNGWKEMNHNPYSQHNGIQQAGRHAVVQQAWDCAPCGKAGCDNSRQSKCMEKLRPQQVLQTLPS
jgi:heptosyltransferase-3